MNRSPRPVHHNLDVDSFEAGVLRKFPNVTFHNYKNQEVQIQKTLIMFILVLIVMECQNWKEIQFDRNRHQDFDEKADDLGKASI